MAESKSVRSLEYRHRGLNQYDSNPLGNRNTCFTRENWENGLFGPLGQPSIGQQ